MAKSPSSNTVLKDAAVVQSLWQSIPGFKAGNTSFKDFQAALTEADSLAKDYARMDHELTGVRCNRDDKALELQDILVRFRSAVRAMYGADSTEYQQAGMTRTRDRKPPKPKSALPSA